MGTSFSPRLAALTTLEWRAFRAVCRHPEAVPLEAVVRDLANPEPPSSSTVANGLSHAREKGWLHCELQQKGARKAQFFSPAISYADALQEVFLSFVQEHDLDAGDLDFLKQLLADRLSA